MIASYTHTSQPIASSSTHQRVRVRAPSAWAAPVKEEATDPREPPPSMGTTVDKRMILAAAVEGKPACTPAHRGAGSRPRACSTSSTRGSAAAVRRQEPGAE